MIDLYCWTTPNGHKITMFLEETGTPYRVIPVNISTGDQFKPEFLAISPNNRIPAIVDAEPGDGGAPVSVFESGAILQYLADQNLDDIPNQRRWFDTIRARPATVRAYEVAKTITVAPTLSEESKKLLFGQSADTLKKS